MENSCSDFCMYCEYIGEERTVMKDVYLYQCQNPKSKNYHKIFDEFNLDTNTCKEYDMDADTPG